MLDNYKVEMAGIEPASERFDPRNSTSVACRYSSSHASRQAGKPATIRWSFACLAESHAAPYLCLARSVTGWGTGTVDVTPLGANRYDLVALGGKGHSGVSAVVGT